MEWCRRNNIVISVSICPKAKRITDNMVLGELSKGKKKPVSTGPAVTSAEFIVDSDVEAASTDDGRPSRSTKIAHEKRDALAKGIPSKQKISKRKAGQEVQHQIVIEGPRKKLRFESNREEEFETPEAVSNHEGSQDSIEINPDEVADTGSSQNSSMSKVATLGSATPVMSSKALRNSKPNLVPDSARNGRLQRENETDQAQDLSQSVAHNKTDSSDVQAGSSSTTEVEQLLLFQLPKGFRQASVYTAPSLPAVEPASGVKDKLLWHITAPASIPFENITKMNIHDMLNGAPINSHEGVDYSFQVEPKLPSTSCQLLVPNENGKSYRPASRFIDQVLHLQQSIPLDQSEKSMDVPGKSPKISEYTRKPIPTQPSSLKMRYKPFGNTNQTNIVMVSGANNIKHTDNLRHVPASTESITDGLVREQSYPIQEHGGIEAKDSMDGNHLEHASDKARAKSPAKTPIKAKHENETAEGKAQRRADKIRSPTRNTKRKRFKSEGQLR